MAQEIDVVAMRKQITTKLKTLQDTLKAYHTAADKYDAEFKVAQEKYEKDLAAWNIKAAKALLASAKDVENVSVDIRGTSAATIFLNGVDLSKVSPRPKFDRWDFKPEAAKKKIELYNAVPKYFDKYTRQVSSDAVIYHLQKALEMLDVLPKGTTTVTVKDFDFLTKF